MSKLSQAKFEELLAQTNLQALNQIDRESLFNAHELLHFGKKEEVFRSRDEGIAFYIVAAGRFSLFLGNGKSKALNKGMLFGEIAALTNLPRLGSAFAIEEPASLVSISKNSLTKAGLLPSDQKPNLLALLFLNAVSYLHESFDNSIESILAKGEGLHSEFKEGSGNPNVLKAVAAFLNSNGGTLLIGVNDAVEVVGVENYSPAQADKFDQDFQNLLRVKMGSEALAFVRFSHGKYHGSGIYRIDCTPSHEPVFLRDGKGVASERFIIRSGATNQELNYKSALKFIARRFPQFLFSGNEAL